MSEGPGKYDELAGILLGGMRAEGIVLCVFNGHMGTGCAVKASPKLALKLPEMLRNIAKGIEQDNKARFAREQERKMV